MGHSDDVVRAHRVETVLHLGADLVVGRRHDRRDITRRVAGVTVASKGPDLHVSCRSQREALSVQTRAKSRVLDRGKLSATSRIRGEASMDETAVATTTGVAQVVDLNALKGFDTDNPVRQVLFQADPHWTESAL